jgi:hypothetical protein
VIATLAESLTSRISLPEMSLTMIDFSANLMSSLRVGLANLIGRMKKQITATFGAVPEGDRERTHEWRFQIGDAFPSDSPLARFIVAVARGMDDTTLANGYFASANQDYERLYFFTLASCHLHEMAETLRKAHTQWQEVRDFVARFDDEWQDEFNRIIALADQPPPWPGNRLKELRNSFFHSLKLDRAAAEAGRLPLQRGLTDASEMEGSIIIEDGGPLNGIRSLFADEVFVKTFTADYEEDELERLVASFAEYQPALNRFAQAAVGRYLAELPEGVVEGGEVNA